MQLTLPVLTVINRDMTVIKEEIQESIVIGGTPNEDIRGTEVQGIGPYAFSHASIPIYEEREDVNAAQLDLGELQVALRRSHGAPGPRLDKFLLANVGSRFIAAPGDPSPFVWRDVGTVDCGTLSGTAAVYCTVMTVGRR